MSTTTTAYITANTSRTGNTSVCSLFQKDSVALTGCNTISGKDACTVQCMVAGTCTAISDIVPDSNPVYVVPHVLWLSSSFRESFIIVQCMVRSMNQR